MGILRTHRDGCVWWRGWLSGGGVGRGPAGGRAMGGGPVAMCQFLTYTACAGVGEGGGVMAGLHGACEVGGRERGGRSAHPRMEADDRENPHWRRAALEAAAWTTPSPHAQAASPLHSPPPLLDRLLQPAGAARRAMPTPAVSPGSRGGAAGSPARRRRRRPPRGGARAEVGGGGGRRPRCRHGARRQLPRCLRGRRSARQGRRRRGGPTAAAVGSRVARRTPPPASRALSLFASHQDGTWPAVKLPGRRGGGPYVAASRRWLARRLLTRVLHRVTGTGGPRTDG